MYPSRHSYGLSEDEQTQQLIQQIPGIVEAVTGGSGRTGVAKLKAKIKNLRRMRRHVPQGIARDALNNRIRTLKAALAAKQEELKIKQATEASRVRWRTLGQGGLVVGIGILSLIGYGIFRAESRAERRYQREVKRRIRK